VLRWRTVGMTWQIQPHYRKHARAYLLLVVPPPFSSMLSSRDASVCYFF
jgi:hypothetical protein